MQLELAQEEAARMQKDYETLIQERNSTLRERNGLKQQCTAAIHQWDIALRERNEYREALAKVSQQHEDAVKEINQAMVLRMKANKDIKRLTEERNAAMQEYSLIMGERDTVHKEMEKLGDDLSQAYAKITHLENENKQLLEEVNCRVKTNFVMSFVFTILNSFIAIIYFTLNQFLLLKFLEESRILPNRDSSARDFIRPP